MARGFVWEKVAGCSKANAILYSQPGWVGQVTQ